MDHWTRVTVEEATEAQTGTGNVRRTWSDYLSDIEARVLPANVTELAQAWATPEEDAYEVHLRGAQTGIRPLMRVVVGADAYDIRKVITAPPFGEPVTILQTVLVTP